MFIVKNKNKMNIKLLTLIFILTLCFIFGFEKKSYSLNKLTQDNISELKILNYFPQDNKTFFISNTNISQITNYIRNNYETKEEDELAFIKNSIFAYLGIDLGTNRLEDIYNNELIITTFDNKENDKDDVLLIFKIKENKDIDDVLNLKNKIDETDKMIKIYRENKLNYFKYIYRTNDNYILTSSNKKLILDALKSNNVSRKIRPKYNSSKEILKNLKNENNILFTKNLKTNELLNNENYLQTKDDYLVTLFDFKDKKIVLKSYLANNIKSLDTMSYAKIDKDNILDAKNYQISIFNDLKNSYQYLENVDINSFEKAIFNELNDKLENNLLLLISDKNWVIIFDKNCLSVENIKLLNDFNKNNLKNNNKIYTLYTKNILKKEEDIVKESNYKKIFSVQSDNLTFISNSLINEKDIDLISQKFFTSKGNSLANYFLNKEVNLKNLNFIQPNNISYLKNFKYFFKNVINLSIVEFKAIIKQSIPETTPIYYAETNLKIF